MRVPAPGELPPPTFKNFITELASTALVCLGFIESPVLKKRSIDADRASHIIDLLELLEIKTHGNLNEEEALYLATVLADLREKLATVRAQPG